MTRSLRLSWSAYTDHFVPNTFSSIKVKVVCGCFVVPVLLDQLVSQAVTVLRTSSKKIVFGVLNRLEGGSRGGSQYTLLLQCKVIYESQKVFYTWFGLFNIHFKQLR